MKTALKGGEQERLQTLRFVLAQLQNREKEKQATGQAPHLTDEETMEVLQREAKKRRESAALFEKGGRPDLKEKEERELVIIQAYLPAMMSDEEVRKVIEQLVAAGNNEFSSLMRESMKQLKGKAEGGRVTQLVKEQLEKI